MNLWDVGSVAQCRLMCRENFEKFDTNKDGHLEFVVPHETDSHGIHAVSNKWRCLLDSSESAVQLQCAPELLIHIE